MGLERGAQGWIVESAKALIWLSGEYESLNRRRGLVKEVNPRGSDVIITADVPLAEMFGYANAIRSMSKGRASYSMTPRRFEPVPVEIARQVLGKLKK